MAHWTVTLEAAWFTAAGGHDRWQPPEGSRPLIPAALRGTPGTNLYVGRVLLANGRLVFHLTYSDSGSFSADAGADLSSAFETGGTVQLVATGTDAAEHTLRVQPADATTSDTTEPYVWDFDRTAGNPGAEIDDFRAILSNTNADQAATLTIWDGAGTNPFDPSDTTAPALSSVSTDSSTGREITLTFDEALDSGHVPPADAFTITVTGRSNSFFPAIVEIFGVSVHLGIAEANAIRFGEALTIGYNPAAIAAATRLQDVAGNEVDTIRAEPVTNNVPDPNADTTAPTLASAATSADGATIDLTFNEDLDGNSIPAVAAFAVTVAGAARGVSAVARPSAPVIRLTLASAVTSGQAVTVAYTQPPANRLQDAAGNQVATFAAQNVTNSVPAPSFDELALTLHHAGTNLLSADNSWRNRTSIQSEGGISADYLRQDSAGDVFLGGSGFDFGDGTGNSTWTLLVPQFIEGVEEVEWTLEKADGTVLLTIENPPAYSSDVLGGSSNRGGYTQTIRNPALFDALTTEVTAGRDLVFRIRDPDIRIAGIGTSAVDGSAALTLERVPDVRIAGIGSTAVGGSAGPPAVTEPPDVRVAGIGTTAIDGSAAPPAITEPPAVRIAGIGSATVGGAAALTVDPLGRLFPHEGTLTKDGNWWNESPGTLPAGMTTAASGDQALNVRVAGSSGNRLLRVRLSGGTTVEFSDPVENVVRIALWDASSADPDEFLIDVPLRNDPDRDAAYNIPITQAQYSAINGAGNTLYYRLHIEQMVRLGGVGTSAVDGSAGLTVTEPPDIRVAGVGSSAIDGAAALAVMPPPDIRIAGVGSSPVGGSAGLRLERVPDVRITGVGVSQIDGTARLTLVRVADVRIAGIGLSTVGGSAAPIVVTPHGNPDIRVAGIGTSPVSGSAALTVQEPTPLTPDEAETFGRAHTRDLTRTSDFFALVITHPDIDDPIRVVADNLDISIDGNTFTALAFRAVPPNFQEGETPRAVLEVDNVGRELTQWIETTSGGRGAMMEVLQVVRDPEVPTVGHIVWRLPALPVGVTEVTNEVVQVALAYRTGRARPGVKIRHTYEVSPGIFQG